MKKLISVLLVTCLTGVLFVSATLADSGMIAPGENLVVEGIPAIPASLADEVGRYTEFRSAAISSWHPLRREMLITTRFGDSNQIHLVKMPGGARTQLTFYPDSVSGAGYSPVKNDSFVFVKDVGG